MRFRNRTDAGQQLAAHLKAFANRSDVIVLGLPRGGIPVAREVATGLKAPLEAFLVRKLGVPGHSEFAMGAIAAGGIEVLNHEVIRHLGIPHALVEQVAVRERLELERRDVVYRAGRRPPVIRDRTVIVVDDGLATGSTMEAAILALRQQKPARIVVGVPVGARDTCERLRRLADEVVCVSTPDPFDAVGLWYEEFSQTTDDEVIRLLAAQPEKPSNPGPAPRKGDTASLVRDRAIRLSGDPRQYDALLAGIGDARIVLLGEATHGTHEFYRERAFITRRLIEEKGFAGVAVEADWPDAYRINRYVRGAGEDEDAVQALADFGRFPTWMWRNADVLDFIGWLRSHNDTQPADKRAGFYGLDLYSLRASMEAVLAYLDKVDPAAAGRARRRYGCFDQFGEEMQEYGYAASAGFHPSCEREVVTQLLELHRQRTAYASRDGRVAADEYFFAEQNARLVRNAEEYYRTMFRGRADSWNLRDTAHGRHAAGADGLSRSHHGRRAPRRLGAQLASGRRPRHRDGPAGRTERRAARAGGVRREGRARRLHDAHGHRHGRVGMGRPGPSQGTCGRRWPAATSACSTRCRCRGSCCRCAPIWSWRRRWRLRAWSARSASSILPETERPSHYFHARLPEQFDFVLHFDETRAVEPLERQALWEAGEVAETFPSGL